MSTFLTKGYIQAQIQPQIGRKSHKIYSNNEKKAD